MPSASIADSGRYLAAMYSGNDSGLLISNDFGNTWMAVRQFASTAVGAVSMTGNGQFAYLITDVATFSYIMVYDRQRDLLTQLPSPKTMWTSISTDGNGQHVLAVSLEGDSSRAGLYVSNDFGNTWTKTHDIK